RDGSRVAAGAGGEECDGADEESFHALGHTGGCTRGTTKLDLNACAGLLLLRRGAALLRPGLHGPDQDLAGPGELDRFRARLGAGLGRRLPAGPRVEEVGAAHAPDVRPA